MKTNCGILYVLRLEVPGQPLNCMQQTLRRRETTFSVNMELREVACIVIHVAFASRHESTNLYQHSEKFDQMLDTKPA
jgi:hypothetical protein